MIKVRNMKIYVKDKYSKWENTIQSFKWVCSEKIHSAQKKKSIYIWKGSERTVKLQVKESNSKTLEWIINGKMLRRQAV